MERLLGGGRLVAYDAAASGPRALRTDADLLHAAGFRSVVTTETSRALAPVCRIFKRRGFRTVLAGVADPSDAAEVRRAIHLRRCVDGYVVGTGGLAAGRYDRPTLEVAVVRVRARSGRPVTTREPAESYGDDPTLLRLGDWIFPVLQPWSAGVRDPQTACGWTLFAYRDLALRAPAGVATVVGATGFPTAADPTSQSVQRAYVDCLASRFVPFAYWEAFDPSEGPAWGFFTADRRPKLWAARQRRPDGSAPPTAHVPSSPPPRDRGAGPP